MASRAFDSFGRDDGPLGSAETGQPYVIHRAGTTPPSIKNGRAYFVPSRPGTFAVVNCGAGAGDATVSMDQAPGNYGHTSLYFRVQDVNNFWRMTDAYREYQEQYISGYTDPIYGWVGNGTYYYEPKGDFVYRLTSRYFGSQPNGTYHEAYDYRINAYTSKYVIYGTTERSIDHYVVRSVYENQTYQIVGGNQPIYSWRTVHTHDVRIERFSNGTVAETWTGYNKSTGYSRFRVELDGPKMRALVDDVLIRSWESPALATARHHGFGYGDLSSVLYGNLGIDNFTVNPRKLTPYMPHLIL